jgi:hypothetical protein
MEMYLFFVLLLLPLLLLRQINKEREIHFRLLMLLCVLLNRAQFCYYCFTLESSQ